MAIVGVNFHGPISHPATTKLRNLLCATVNERITNGPDAGKRKHDKLCLFINSLGGQLDDGISLFGFLRSLPLELTTINVGLVASVAIVPFMAGKKRIAFPHSLFHFHDYEWNYAAAHNLTRLEFIDHTQLLSSIKNITLKILQENTSLTQEDFKQLQLLDVPAVQGAAFAKERGIVHEINYFAFPEEMAVFNVDY